MNISIPPMLAWLRIHVVLNQQKCPTKERRKHRNDVKKEKKDLHLKYKML